MGAAYLRCHRKVEAASMNVSLCLSLNRTEFVSAFINYAFNKSVERVFEEFRRGFFKVCDIDVVEFFQPEELQGVMVGQENYDWDVFKQVCRVHKHRYTGMFTNRADLKSHSDFLFCNSC